MSDHGEEAEDLVEELCRRSFLGDFVVRAPMFKKSGGGHREAADLLLPFRDILITFQVRARRLSAAASAGDADKTELDRISRRIEKAVQQVKTIRRALDTGSLASVENLRGITLPFDCSKFRTTVGIVVVDLVAEGKVSKELQIELYGGIDRVRDIPVHVFLRRDLEIVLSELDTIPDFLQYLSAREAIMRKRALLPLTGETDFMAMFQTRHDEIRRCLDGEIDLLVLEEGLWEATKRQHAKQFEERERRRAVSRLVDKTIESVHRCIGFNVGDNLGDVGWASDLAASGVREYQVVAEELSGLTRVQRMELGEAMLMKAQQADSDPKEFAYRVFMPGGDQIPIVCLCSRSSRSERRRQLYKVASVAYVHLSLKRIIGIAMDNYSAREMSQDYLLMDGVQFENEADLRALGPRLFGPLRGLQPDQWGNDYSNRGGLPN